MPDHQLVKNLFRTAAKRYNFVNSVLSFGQDACWRKKVAKAVSMSHSHKIVDLATGSGVLAFAIAREYREQKISCDILGVDFCEELLEIARKDSKKLGLERTTQFQTGNALAVALPDQSADAVTVSFGLRNFEDRQRAYAEMRRLLKSGGRLFILEFSQPEGFMGPLYKLYEKLLPNIAWILGQEKESYEYLCSSIRGFPNASALAEELRSSGFKNISFEKLTGGVVALHQAIN